MDLEVECKVYEVEESYLEEERNEEKLLLLKEDSFFCIR